MATKDPFLHDELREELTTVGVSLYFARVKRHLERFFNEEFSKERLKAAKKRRFQTLKPAINADLKHQQAKGQTLVDADATDPGSDEREWREQIEPPRMEKQDTIPASPEDKDQIQPDRTPDA